MTVIAVVLVAAAFAVTRATRDNLVDRVDDELKASIGRVEEDLGTGPGSRRGFSELYAEVVTRRGARVVLLAPDDLDAPIRPDLDIDEIRSAANDESFTSGAIDGSGASVSKRFRVLVAGDRSGASLMIALPLDQVDASMSRLITLEVIVTIVVLGVLALVAWWVVRLGIRPVKQMATAASAIGAGDLSHRVPEATAGTEVGDLGVALNNMLGQIETSFDNQRRSEERLRQFVADASHELRTPVATVRGYAELYRSGGLDDPSQLDEAMRRSEQEAIRMGTLVDDLLLLARLDQGRPLMLAPVRLDELVTDAVADARARHPDRRIELTAGRAVHVTGDESRLGQVVANLVSNAIVHTTAPAGVEVTVAAVASETGPRATVTVRDDGPGMAPDVAARVFERFYRADPMRTRDRGGSGLGLCIAEAITVAHHGTIDVDSAHGCGTTFTVSLPSSSPPPPSPTAPAP